MELTWDESNDEIKVSDTEIAEIEQKYNIVLPLSYKKMLKYHSGDYSEELEEMIECHDIGDMSDKGEWYCLSYMKEEELKKVLPIFLSTDGNYYALDYNILNQQGEPTIIDIDHELDEGTSDDIHRFNSFDEFIDDIVKYYKEINE